MNGEAIYSYLVDISWMFLLGWILVLLLAFVAVFHQET
jgi:hypothetical protein